MDVDDIDMIETYEGIKQNKHHLKYIAIVYSWLGRALIILVAFIDACWRLLVPVAVQTASPTTRMEEMRLSRNLQPRSPRPSFKFLKASI